MLDSIHEHRRIRSSVRWSPVSPRLVGQRLVIGRVNPPLPPAPIPWNLHIACGEWSKVMVGAVVESPDRGGDHEECRRPVWWDACEASCHVGCVRGRLLPEFEFSGNENGRCGVCEANSTVGMQWQMHCLVLWRSHWGLGLWWQMELLAPIRRLKVRSTWFFFEYLLHISIVALISYM